MCFRKIWRVYQRGLERWITDLLQPVFDGLISVSAAWLGLSGWGALDHRPAAARVRWAHIGESCLAGDIKGCRGFWGGRALDHRPAAARV
jgi:hypothetical protein